MVKRHMAKVRKAKVRTRPLVLNTNSFKLPPVDARYKVAINTAHVWGVKREFPPVDWDHWKVFGMKPTLKRAAVIERYHELPRSWEVDVAYGRILGELWAKGVYPKDY
jgi:hypothetical protein